MAEAKIKRCGWADHHPLQQRYHDEEWGIPVWDDLKLHEFLLLEGAQAGLSWQTILVRREGYRNAYAGFDPVRVAAFTPDDEARLLQDAGIIRNRLKVAASVTNAAAFLKVQEEYGSFATYLWSFVEGRPVVNRPATLAEIPASTPLSDRISRDLKRRGFRFVGTTIVYAYLQAVGVVDDHVVDCFRCLPEEAATRPESSSNY